MKTPRPAPRDSVHRAPSPATDGKNQQMGDFVDNRPSAAAQAQLASAIDASPKQAAQRKTSEALSQGSAQRMTSGGVIQRKGYELSGASDPQAIAEQEVGSGKTIRFTTFTSCIGVIGKKDDGSLVGIHLVRFGKHGEPFMADDVPAVKAKLSGLSDITIIGQTDFWEQDLLNAIGGKVVGGTDDGSFQATTDAGGKIVVKK